MSIEKILTDSLTRKSVTLYLLDLIDMKYINLDKSYVTPSSEIYFNIDIDKSPKYFDTSGIIEPRDILENTLFDFTFNISYASALCAGYSSEEIKDVIHRKILPNHEEEYYIPFVVCSKAKTCRIDTFAVKYKGVLDSPQDDYVKTTMECFEMAKQPEYKIYKERFKTFSGEAIEWVKQQIRNTLLKNTLGDFYADDLQQYTYSCRRKLDNRDIFYVIYEWWRHLREGGVTWTDLDNGKNNIFAALIE